MNTNTNTNRERESQPGIRQGGQLSKMGYGAGEARWHLLCVNGKQERLARAYLLRSRHEVYLPLRLVQGQHAVYGKPLFPGYLFVRVHQDAEWRDIFCTPGVAGVYSAGDRPATLAKAVVELIRGREQGGFVRLGGEVEIECAFTHGQKVKVGVLEAIFQERVDATRCRLLVSLCGADSKPTVVQMSQVQST